MEGPAVALSQLDVIAWDTIEQDAVPDHREMGRVGCKQHFLLLLTWHTDQYFTRQSLGMNVLPSESLDMEGLFRPPLAALVRKDMF